MKKYRAKIVVTNEVEYSHPDTLRRYTTHTFNEIVNHYFNEADKENVWKDIQNSHKGLNKKIDIFKRHNSEVRNYGDGDVIIYKEEIIYTNK